MTMFKSIVAIMAVFASVLFAHGANVSSVETKMGTLTADGSIYTASSLEYKASPSNNSAPYRNVEGWYAGLKLNWDSQKQVATSTSAQVDDNISGSLVQSFTVGYAKNATTSSCTDQSPSGKGLANTFYSVGSGWVVKTYTHYMSTTEWYIYVTPEKMYECYCAEKDYTATLTIGGNIYTITVPKDIVLSDGSHQRYPAVGLLGEKVYGDAQYLADQIKLENHTTVKFLADPVGLTFPDGFKAGSQGEDGKWGVALDHQHSWTFSPDGATLTATCSKEGCPYETASVTLALSSGDKTYDNTAITATADFGEYFKDIFPDATMMISTTKDNEPVDNDTIKNAGVYTVKMIVTGLGDEQSYELSKTVTISKVDISEATLTLSPASTSYNGKEQTVTPSVKVNGLTATIEVDAENSTTSATEIGTYSVSVNGTGNFVGTVSATWEIKNTTGSLKSVTSAVSGIGDFDSENNTLTVGDTTALEYSDGAWFAGITLEWPVETKGYSGYHQYGHAYYITEASAKYAADEGVFTNEPGHGSYQYDLISSYSFDYLSTTTWKVAITPAVVEAALSEEKTSLEWTMNAGAIQSDTYANGVAFQDYTITLPLDEPVEFMLGAGETYDLGDTVLTTTRIQLAAGASVTSSVAQTVADAIYTEVTGYEVVFSEDGGKYVYAAQLTHVHDWSVEKAENGYELIATCANADCDINGGEVKMWLDVGATEKTYDGKSVTRVAVYGDGFKTVYPDVTAVLTVNDVENGVINDAGEYTAKLTVTGLGDEKTYELSRTVTISKVDISETALVLTPANPTYTGAEQTVTPSVTANNLTATFDVDTGNSTTAATEMGTYTVIVNGTGNFTGSTSATWSIVNTTGTPTSVTASPSGSMTASGNDFTLSDSSKLEYDAENAVWYAGITIAWPMEKHDSWTAGGYAHYVKMDSVQVTVSDGSVSHATQSDKFRQSLTSGEKAFTYLSTTTWKVPLTPTIISEALAEEKTELVYTMTAGAIIWGNSTEGDTDGVMFQDYTITIPLEGIKLYDGDGNQVYPKPEGQTIIEEIKETIETTNPDDKEKVEAKVDLVAEIAGEGNEQAVADWVAEVKSGYATPADFFDALAESDYVEASFKLGTEKLITEDSEVAVADFEPSEDGFTFEVKIDDGNIEAARVKAASIIQTATSLGGDGGFSSLAVYRISFDGNKITIIKDPNFDREFFKIVIDKDSAK